MFIGAHIEIGKDSIQNIPKKSAESGGNTMQIYLGNKISYKVSHYTHEQKKLFQNAMKQFKQHYCVIHSKLLINLASNNPEIYNKSFETIQEEIQEASQLGFSYVVFHPNSPGKNRHQEGCMQIIKALESLIIPKGVMVLLENSAGEGHKIGTYLEDLSFILNNVFQNRSQIGVCIDTAHLYSSGYDIATNFDSVKETIQNYIGFKNIHVIHFNDSKKPLGSKKDVHEDIGYGYIGEKGLSNVISDKDFQKCVFICETPGNEKWNIQKSRNVIKN